MTVEAWGAKGGRKLTLRVKDSAAIWTAESPMDGSDATVLLDGKPSDETEGIKWVDDQVVIVGKVNGKQYRISRGTLSANSNTLTVETERNEVGGQPGKYTEVWVRK